MIGSMLKFDNKKVEIWNFEASVFFFKDNMMSKIIAPEIEVEAEPDSNKKKN